MTKLSALLMAASAVLTTALMGNTSAAADVLDRDTETRGGMLGGVQTPSISEKGSFVHRGKSIVWVPNETLEQNRPQQRAVTTPNKVVGREVGGAVPRVKAVTAEGAFVQNGKITTFVPSEDLAAHLRNTSPGGRFFNPAGRVVLLGGAEVHRDLLADLSQGYVVDAKTLTQPPTVTKNGAFIHKGKTIQWVPNANSGPMLGQ
jgi:hypothetical protein